MIFEYLFGLIVAIGFIVLIGLVKYTDSANRWILAISKFVYFAGHPVLDDDEKFERVSRDYRSVALSLLGVILKTVLIIALSLGAIAVIATVGGYFRGQTLPDASFGNLLSAVFPSYLLDWPFILGTLTPLALLPFLPKKEPEEEYSSLGKFLHYFFLGNKVAAKLQFKLECFLNRKLIRSSSPAQHVYISGLARSGSTSLMQYVGQLPGFVSLSYLNMPFIFMPRTGPKIMSKDKGGEKERSHKDGMTHSLSTYEALEEPFWLHYAGRDYVCDDRLIGHRVSPKVHHEYQKFRTLVAEDKTYLAKNNNHLLRAKSLQQLDAENSLRTRTIIPFREPYAQAKSLLQQHRNLAALQSENDFALDYMDFLVHHEFGLHRKTLVPSFEEGTPLPEADPNTIEHWLEVWFIFYQQAISLYEGVPGFCFFCYESYRRNPRQSLLRLCPFMGVDPEQMDALEVKAWEAGVPEQVTEPDGKLMALYDRMVSLAINHEV